MSQIGEAVALKDELDEEHQLDEPELERHGRSSRHMFGGSIVQVGGQRFRVHEYGGGLINLYATVASTVYVGPHAMIKDRAIVVGSVRLFDRATIEGNAIVADSCTLREDACIGGQAIVRGQVTLAHHARIDGDARVNGGVLLQHFAHISRGVLSGGMTVS